jgi:hypothetical protein
LAAFDFGPKFPLGGVYITQAAAAVLSSADVGGALQRHQRGDWGELDSHDVQENELALAHEERLFSVYRSTTGVKFYVSTEPDRSRTTILLPEDY